MEEQAGVLIDERLVAFEAAPNFRDIGGYPTGDGGQVAWGAVYRAGRLDAMTASDRERFAALGIASVFDLRNADEIALRPDPVDSLHIEMVAKMRSVLGRPDFSTLVGHDDGVEFMRRLYVGLIEHAAHEIGTVVARLAAGELPAVIHCTAGKDRTGTLIAVLLEALGVERRHVLDDFELSGRYHHPGHTADAISVMVSHGVAPEAAAGAMSVSRASMASALAELDARFGGAARYLVDHAGVTAEQLATLRQRLVSRSWCQT